MENNEIEDKAELYIGGSIALIAVIAVFVQIALSGFSLSSILDGFVNLAQVIVAAMVLLIAIKRIVDRRQPAETFESALTRELSSWEERNKPLISRNGDVNGNYRFFMLTDHDNMLKVANEQVKSYKKGLFVELPLLGSYRSETTFDFYLNLSTFQERAKAKESTPEDEVNRLAGAVAACICAKFPDAFIASPEEKKGGHAALINVKLKQDFTTPADAYRIIHLLDYVLMLYIAAA